MKLKKYINLLDFLFINVGLLLTAFSIIVFLVPGKLAAGGISGVATIIWHLFNIPIGTMMLLINIPLFFMGIRVFGRGYGAKSIYGIIMLSVYLYLLENISWFTPLQRIAEDNLLIATVYGGVIGGVGMGMVLSLGSNTGGTDILAQVLNKYFKIPLGTSLIVVDILIIISSAVTFGLEVMLYACICLYLTGKMINVIEGFIRNHYFTSRFYIALNKRRLRV